MRVYIIMPFLLVVIGNSSCSRRGITGRTDAHEDSLDFMDSALDSTSDIILDDLGDDIDAILDSRVEIDIEEAHDSPVDVVPSDPEIEGPVSMCNVIDQTGCADGEWCSWRFDEDFCVPYEDCFSGPTGILGVEEECDPWSSDHAYHCLPGLECGAYDDPGIIACHQWCRTDLDCSIPGRTCSVEFAYVAGFGPCVGRRIVYPYNFCTIGP